MAMASGWPPSAHACERWCREAHVDDDQVARRVDEVDAGVDADQGIVAPHRDRRRLATERHDAVGRRTRGVRDVDEADELLLAVRIDQETAATGRSHDLGHGLDVFARVLEDGERGDASERPVTAAPRRGPGDRGRTEHRGTQGEKEQSRERSRCDSCRHVAEGRFACLRRRRHRVAVCHPHAGRSSRAGC